MAKCYLRTGVLIVFVVSSFVFIDCKENCESCVLTSRCPLYGNMSRKEQQRWLLDYSCESYQPDANGTPFGFASVAKGDFVCCPNSNSPWSNDYQASGTGPLHQSETGNYNNDDVPYDSSRVFYPKMVTRYKPNIRNTPSRVDRDDRVFDGVNGGMNTGGFGGQCQALSSFPPNPDTGCCGRASSVSERISNSPQAQSNWRQPTNFQQNPSSFSNPVNNQIRNPVQTPMQSSAQNPFSLNSWFPQTFGFPSFGRRFKRESHSDKSQEVTVEVDNRITGGIATDLDEYPWTVLLRTTFDYGYKKSSFDCGGSIISSRYVLTAAHCVFETDATVSDIKLYLAEYDKRTFPLDCKVNRDGERKCVENIVIHYEDYTTHPNYDDTRLQNDIALIRLKENAPYSDFIRPICLPPFNIDNPDYSNLSLEVAGWGRNGTVSSNVKQSTVVHLVPQEKCTRHYPHLTKRHLCAAGYSGEDTCKGDSGGPLMMIYQGKYFVSGIVSGKRADSPCGTRVPSLYTNVFHYLDWIRNTIRN